MRVSIATILLILSTVLFSVHAQEKNPDTSAPVKNHSIADYVPKPFKAGNAVQQYFDQDSLHVFWTRYPDPFSSPCPKGTHQVSQSLSFFCGLPGKIEIGVLDIKRNTILHKHEIPRNDSSN